MVIILDTNFLLIPGQFKVDIFTEIDRICHFPYELKVTKQTIDELNKLQQKEKAAVLALRLIKHKKIKQLACPGKLADEAILAYCEKHECIIATQDKKLIKQVKETNNKIISMRQKKYLVFT